MIKFPSIIAVYAILIVVLSSCGDTSGEPPVLLFSTSASDYLFKGGKGSTWEYSHTEIAVDTNGVLTRSPEDGMRVRFTLLDTGVTRKDVSHITVMLRESFINGVLNDVDTLYFTNNSGSVVMHRLPLRSIQSSQVVIADPLVEGSSFKTNPESSSSAVVYFDDVDVQVQTQAGLFRSVSLVENSVDTLSDGSMRTRNVKTSIAPWNMFLEQTSIETTKFVSGKSIVETTSASIVKIDIKN